MRRWKVAEAKQRFSQLVKAAGEEPQQILNRSRPVAAVVDAGDFAAFEEWRRARRSSLAEAFADLRRICAEEGYRLKVGRRRNRANPFARALASR